MGTRNFGPAVGSKSWISIVEETTAGRLRTGTSIGSYLAGETEMYIPFTTESIANTINMLESATLDPTRGALNSIRGTSDITGDIAFELRGQGYGQLIKQAMGDGTTGSANYVRVNNARGDIGMQVDGYHAPAAIQLNLKGSREIMADWVTIFTVGGGALVHIERNATGLLVAQPETWVAVADIHILGVAGDPTYWHHIVCTAPGGVVAAAYDGAWVFPVDATKFGGCYLHYLELGTDLPTGLNVDIMRDIALFVYTGMKVGTWTMNFNAGEIVNGTFTLVGKEEFCGGLLTTAIMNNVVTPPVVPAARTLVIDDGRIFCNYPGVTTTDSSKLMLGHEGDISYCTAGLAIPINALLDTDANMDNAVPISIVTDATVNGAIVEGTDQAGAGPWTGWATARNSWGYFANTPVVPMSGRACVSGTGPVDLRTTMQDLPAYSFFEAGILMSSGLAGVGGGTVDTEGRMGLEELEVMKATFTVENNLYKDKYALGSRFRVKLIEQKRAVTGTLSFEFDNLNQYRKFFDGRIFQFVIKCISVDPDKGSCSSGVGSIAVPYSTCFYFNKCKYTGATPTANGPDMIMTDMPFTAYVDPGLTLSSKAFTELAVWMTNKRSVVLW